jgi:DNA repair protein RecO (recombination protein O)
VLRFPPGESVLRLYAGDGVETGGMGLRHDQGIVLRSFPFGEADRVVVLLSPNHGKLRTVAKGVRKTKSRFGGRLEPFTHVDLVLYEGRNLDTITQVEVIDAFPRLRTDLRSVMAAGSMVEAIDAVTQENERSTRAFLLLQRSLKALESGPPHADLVTSFLLKVADVVGVAPALDVCAGCGTREGLHRFAFAAGGVLCEKCRTAGAVVLRDGLTTYLAALAASAVDDLPVADPALTKDALGVTRRFLEYHLDRRLMATVTGE